MTTKAVTVTLDDLNVERARTAAEAAGLSLSAYVDQAVRRENARRLAEGYAAWLASDDPVAAEHRVRREANAAASLARLDAAHGTAR